jgi:hypothetical protein
MCHVLFATQVRWSLLVSGVVEIEVDDDPCVSAAGEDEDQDPLAPYRPQPQLLKASSRSDRR